ncbi:MAG: amidophosphoribosyltransferase [Abditibacteriota bacterium]|nr:amidophosphoribosyltransferase [Abditibacteriota bacterium]
MVFRHQKSQEVNEECGIFGIFANNRTEEISRTAFFGIFALQHRGQESAGIATTNGHEIFMHREQGLVNQIFTEKNLSELPGHSAICHTRYSATGASIKRNIQPMVAYTRYGEIALAHNGDMVNTPEIRELLGKKGIDFDTTSDSEVLLRLISLSDKPTVQEAISQAMSVVKGAYACVVLTKNEVIGFKDPKGIRPLSLGRLEDGTFAIASESCAFSTIGGRVVRELEPGEIVTLDKNGVSSVQGQKKQGNALCIFEYVYIARPDSNLNGVPVHLARKRMGEELARECPIDGCDLVFPIPNTGIQAATGLAEASGVPFAQAIVKNHYIHRTFIRPNQAMRENAVKMKLIPLRELLEGKKVVMVDDSIVRGTTIGPTIDLIRDAGAKEVHVRIACPKYLFPCFYGIDTCNRDELIATRMSEDEIRRHIGADSLGYLSLEGLFRAVGGDAENTCCAACLNGKYPVEIPSDYKISK